MVRNQTVTVVITANGEGSRMKGISPLPKHLLWYGGKRIVDAIRDCFPKEWPVKVLTRHDTPGHDVIKCGATLDRMQTLYSLLDVGLWGSILIVDCDVIPRGGFPNVFRGIAHAFFGLTRSTHNDTPPTDVIFYFSSACSKYCGLWEQDGRLVRAEERAPLAEKRASGVYFIKDLPMTLRSMGDRNSIASGLLGAQMLQEDSFIRLGDPEDYSKAVRDYGYSS